MKNIHILPTSQSSRLHYYSFDGYGLSTKALHWREARNIYITNDEEIKEDDWVLNTNTNSIAKYIGHGSMDWWVKIILTTDNDLIADGVQAIDDEFLEWFVENPGCEFVEIYELEGKLFAEPTISKEGLKQDLVVPEDYYNEDSKDFEIASLVDFIDDEDETLEEVAENQLRKQNWDTTITLPFNGGYIEGFQQGAKWQSEQLFKDDAIKTLEKGMILLLKKFERMYSEEEVLEHLNHLIMMSSSELDTFTNDEEMVDMRWFEQFKKK